MQYLLHSPDTRSDACVLPFQACDAPVPKGSLVFHFFFRSSFHNHGSRQTIQSLMKKNYPRLIKALLWPARENTRRKCFPNAIMGMAEFALYAAFCFTIFSL